MRYYLKKCGHQELGSVGADGRAHRGRYLLTSKDESVLSLFPPLSISQKNDSALLPIIPLYSNRKVYCNYVYHNGKFHGETRDEYRIYLNKDLENDQLLFCEGDIVIMRSQEDLNGENEKQVVYFVDLISAHSSLEYEELDRIISESPIRGGYGFFDGVLPQFEAKVVKLEQIARNNVMVDNTVTQRLEKNSTDSIAGLFNAASFRDFVMAGYEGLCAITGTVIQFEGYTNLEAAHIKPKSHGGLYLPNNGLALNRDLHWAFDKGFFTLNNNLEVKVHPQTTSDYLKSFDGKRIRIPKNPFFVPDIECVQYHQEVVYGLFLTTGRL